MALDLDKLELVKRLGDGSVKARCPACAEQGGDRKGEHLFIKPDGRYGCCVHPKDHDHRKRVFALTGARKQRWLKVNLRSKPRTLEPLNILKDLSCTIITNSGTGGTGLSFFLEKKPKTGTIDIIESLKDPEHAVAPVPTAPPPTGTTPVPPVPPAPEAEKEPSEPPAKDLKLPFIDSDGVLIVPFGAPERYSWWADGQTAQETIEEVKRRMKAAEKGCDY